MADIQVSVLVKDNVKSCAIYSYGNLNLITTIRLLKQMCDRLTGNLLFE